MSKERLITGLIVQFGGSDLTIHCLTTITTPSASPFVDDVTTHCGQRWQITQVRQIYTIDEMRLAPFHRELICESCLPRIVTMIFNSEIPQSLSDAIISPKFDVSGCACGHSALVSGSLSDTHAEVSASPILHSSCNTRVFIPK